MKFLKRALPIVLAVCLLASLGAVSAIDAGETRTVIGADLTDDQIKTVYKTFGIERGTEYALEQVYNIIDARYRSKKPLIVTTNLTLTDLKNPQDVAHARIYDRLLSMCSPICFAGENLRQQAAAQKTANMRALMKQTI